jgi:sterol 3beta-glucosyltransferase
MKALLMTMGTRGDVQPFVALALELRAAGHDALLVAPHRYASFAGEHGVPNACVDDGPLRLMDDPGQAGVIEGGLRARIAQVRTMPAMFTRLLDDCAAVIRQSPGADADVVVHNGQILAGQHVAEALGVPAVLAVPLPMYIPTRAFPWPGVALPTWLPAALNRATYLGMKAPAAMFGTVVDRWRTRDLGLPRRPGRHDPTRRPDGGPAPILHAFSPHLIPPPADWPDHVTTTGFWYLPPSQLPLPDRVESFLNDGPPPVYVGFGSMVGRDPGRTTAAVLAATRRSGVRLVIGTGWDGLTGDTAHDQVLVVDDVDHQRFFPRTAAVVHHGGAGTTATAFAAGRPQVVCPFTADQPFWARLAHHHGVAPPPLPQSQLDAHRLAASLTTAVTDPAIPHQARDVAERLATEDGVSRAVAALEGVVDQPPCRAA